MDVIFVYCYCFLLYLAQFLFWFHFWFTCDIFYTHCLPCHTTICTFPICWHRKIPTTLPACLATVPALCALPVLPVLTFPTAFCVTPPHFSPPCFLPCLYLPTHLAFTRACLLCPHVCALFFPSLPHHTCHILFPAMPCLGIHCHAFVPCGFCGPHVASFPYTLRLCVLTLLHAFLHTFPTPCPLLLFFCPSLPPYLYYPFLAPPTCVCHACVPFLLPPPSFPSPTTTPFLHIFPTPPPPCTYPATTTTLPPTHPHHHHPHLPPCHHYLLLLYPTFSHSRMLPGLCCLLRFGL